MNFFHLGPLHFQASSWTLLLVTLALIATAICGYLTVKRSARPIRSGLLEGLRFLCVAFVCSMLLAPEWRTVEESTLKPEIAILWDDSYSMTTQDAPRPAFLSKKNEVLQRNELVAEILETEFWADFEENGDNRVTVTSFGGNQSEESLTERSMSGTDLHAALSGVLESAQNLKAVILMSDGDWNTGTSPISAAQKLRLQKVPVYPLAVGNPTRLPDLELLPINAPTYGIVGEKVQIPFTIQSSLNRDIRTQIRLRSESGEERTKQMTLKANRTHYDSILWRIDQEGSSSLSLSLPVASGELIPENNEREFVIGGKPESIKVLVIETKPRWEYRFIRNALSRDPGVQVDCLLLHPSLGPGDGPNYLQQFPDSLEKLQQYDVVFVGDIGIGEKELTVEQANLIKGLIENQASGVVFIPGPQGKQATLAKSELGDLIPVELDPGKKGGLTSSVAHSIRLTSEGENSLLTMLGEDESQNQQIWQSLPGFFWQAAVQRAKAGSTILAVNEARRNSAGRLPVIVTSKAGSGKVLYIAIDSAWRWRRGVEDLYHYRFWGQVARWMSYQRNMAAGERVRLFFTPGRPKPGEFVSLSANAFDLDGAPLERGTLQAQLTAPDQKESVIELTKEPNEWGRFTGKFRLLQGGEWKLKVSVPNEPEAFTETLIISQREPIEKVGRPARIEVLEEIARITEANLIKPAKLDQLVKEIEALPKPSPRISSVKIWAHWLSLALLIALLSAFWVGRKLNGTF